MVTKIQMKMSRSGDTVADKEEEKDSGKDVDENNNLMKDSSV